MSDRGDHDDLIQAPEPSGRPWVAEPVPGSPQESLSDDAGVTEALRLSVSELRSVEVEPVTVNESVPARLYRSPRSDDGPLLVWAHGGAFVRGDLEMPEAHWVGLSLARHGVNVLSVEYRKALRGITYPTPHGDLLAAWRWAVQRAPELSSGRVHIGGASAGGSLAASVALVLRDEGMDQPESVVLAYPTLHRELPPLRRSEVKAIRERAGDTYFSADWIRAMGANYVGDGGADHGRYAFPGDADLGGLPRHLVLLSEYDTLRSSGQKYVDALTQSAIAVTRIVVPGSRHGFLNDPMSDGGATMPRAISGWLKEPAGTEVNPSAWGRRSSPYSCGCARGSSIC